MTTHPAFPPMIVIDIFRLPTGSADYQTNVLIFLRQLLSGTIGYEGYLNRTWEAAGWEVLGRESKISLLRLNKLILVVPGGGRLEAGEAPGQNPKSIC